MTATQHFVVLLSGMFTILLALGSIFGFMIRIIRQWDKTNLELKSLVDDVRELVEDKKEEHKKIWEHIEWLERNRRR